jgi:hypothetical protein
MILLHVESIVEPTTHAPMNERAYIEEKKSAKAEIRLGGHAYNLPDEGFKKIPYM